VDNRGQRVDYGVPAKAASSAGMYPRRGLADAEPTGLTSADRSASTIGRHPLVKIDDVARHAGVAPSTVSYVLSGKRTISEQTRERVMRSVRALGYHPHAGARSLASSRSNVLALVIPLRSGMHVPVIMQFVTSIVTAAREYDHDVLLLTQDEGVAGLRRVAGTSLVDAIIVMDVELFDPRVPVLRELRRPSVLIGIPAEADGLSCIDLDFNAAGALCLEHLADLGHRRVALIGSPPEVYKRETGFATRTVSGFKQAAVRRRVTVSVHPCESTQVAAMAVVAHLTSVQPEVTGVVVHNEAVLEFLIKAFETYGRRVPDDVSVVAIGPDELAEPMGVTSVNIPAKQIAEESVKILMGQLTHENPIMTTHFHTPKLTERESTSAPARANKK
jgi:DNA-binding LacI/PurR family transcriptional regulator